MKYVCELCGFVYDEDKGDPQNKIPAGTRFQDLPEHYECPDCYSERAAFTPVGHEQKITAPQIPDTPVSAPAKQNSDR